MITSREKFILTILLFLLKRELARCRVGSWDAKEVQTHIGVVQNEENKLYKPWGEELIKMAESGTERPINDPEKAVLEEGGIKS